MNAQQQQRAALRRAYPFVGHFVDAGADGMPDTETWSAYLERQDDRNQPGMMARGTRSYHKCEFNDYIQARN